MTEPTCRLRMLGLVHFISSSLFRIRTVPTKAIACVGTEEEVLHSLLLISTPWSTVTIWVATVGEGPSMALQPRRRAEVHDTLPLLSLRSPLASFQRHTRTDNNLAARYFALSAAVDVIFTLPESQWCNQRAQAATGGTTTWHAYFFKGGCRHIRVTGA